MWDSLGFSRSPYEANPLRPVQEDVGLLIGREDEAIRFQTIIESSENGTVLLSGLPGVGKTSFFNVQQFLMETGGSMFGRKLLSARHLCPIQSDDAVSDIALRVLHNTCVNISSYAAVMHVAIPTLALQTFQWLTGKANSGFEFNLQIAGFGGGGGKQTQMPPPGETSFEVLQHVLAALVTEAMTWFSLEGIFIALDNVENLDEEQISSVLMTFRDTFFNIPNVWWVVIGQTGLSSLVQVLDPRVAERMSGGIELTPISAGELHQAIDKRVERFHSNSTGRAPLTQDVHDFLYDASLGEIRFVFNYANKICVEYVSDMRGCLETDPS